MGEAHPMPTTQAEIFPVVYLAHLGSKELAWLDEETQRALLYVGMTRASYKLTLVTSLADTAAILGTLDAAEGLEVVGPEAEEGKVLLRRLARRGAGMRHPEDRA